MKPEIPVRTRPWSRGPEGPNGERIDGPVRDSGARDRGPERDPASFRDPSGVVYRRDGVLLRQVDRTFAGRWDDLVSSGLLDELQRRGLLVAHEPVDRSLALDPTRAHAVIRPEPIRFVSYPYEWSFGALRDAALVTLEAQAVAAAAGFTLRDASAHNVQFHRGRPILIDTLSFERAAPGAPWVAYRQFCEHFLAPLALMAHRDVRLGLLLREHLDGIPLDLAARLLPRRTVLDLGLASHIHLHARAQRRYAERPVDARVRPMTELQQRALVDSLQRTVSRLSWEPAGTEWADYADHTSYGETATCSKDDLVERALEAASGSVVWDLGANVGRYSAIAARQGRDVVAWDVDPAATERHYRAVRRAGETRILPLLLDLANPSPGLGWGHAERRSLLDRADADTVLALALVHHLAISRNVPLALLRDFLARLGPNLIVEFVPKQDPMVRRLLSTREDVFPDYTIEAFRAAFAERYELLAEDPIEGSDRTLLLMRRHA